MLAQQLIADVANAERRSKAYQLWGIDVADELIDIPVTSLNQTHMHLQGRDRHDDESRRRRKLPNLNNIIEISYWTPWEP